MATEFDDLQNDMFDIVSGYFGHKATWTPDVGPMLTGEVLKREPNEKDQVNGMRYAPFVRMVEYRDGVFPGLIEVSRNKSTDPPIIVIDGENYIVRTITAFWDGNTHKAECEIENEY